ncbi:MAG: hypothetical protein L3K01_04260, partial [Thermoplasmata archaeon]|nr:hypothetical protein [Thermoplasmata archaeon]
ALGEIQRATEPVRGFVDEADSRPTDPWPHEAMLPTLDLGGSQGAGRVFLLAGSSGGDIQGMRAVTGGRPKGSDLLSRIPHDHEYAILPMSSEDRLFMASSAERRSAEKLGKPVVEVEKLALVFLASEPEWANPRRARDFHARSVERLPGGEEQLKFDYLFDAGDVGSKEFWTRTRAQQPDLIGSFVTIGE